MSSTESEMSRSLEVDQGGTQGYSSGPEKNMTDSLPSSPTKILSAPQSPNPDNISSPEELRARVQRQIEYYFSRENLLTDAYLMSQMDTDQFVQVATIAGFNQVKKLTTELDVVRDAIRRSESLQLDERGDKVRAFFKRSMLLIREIPQDTPQEEVKELFSRPNVPQCTKLEVAHSNSWYVYFDSEEDAQKAYRYLREEVREFKGNPIHVRLKEKVFQSNNAPSQVPMARQPPMMYPPYMQPRPMMFPPPPPVLFSNFEHPPFVMPPFMNGNIQQGPNNFPPHIQPRQPYIGGGRRGGGGRNTYESGRGPHASRDNRGNRRNYRSGDDYGSSGQGNRGRKRDEDQQRPTSQRIAKSHQNFDLAAPNQFPPLPNSKEKPNSQSLKQEEVDKSLADVVKGTHNQNITGMGSASSQTVGRDTDGDIPPNSNNEGDFSTDKHIEETSLGGVADASTVGVATAQQQPLAQVQVQPQSQAPNSVAKKFNNNHHSQHSHRPVTGSRGEGNRKQVIGSSSNSSRNHGSNRSQTNRQSSSAKSDSKPSGGGYSKSRSKGDRRSMSAGARNSPKQNRPASIPPPPVVSENQGEESFQLTEKMTYAAMAQKQRPSKTSPSSDSKPSLGQPKEPSKKEDQTSQDQPSSPTVTTPTNSPHKETSPQPS